ncbi:MAG: hypothetical protein HQ575_01125 [Candidatus Omnitrophica bacterium]|nr:hypothetical protein [Candidatus Omnitrophota bacterium]
MEKKQYDLCLEILRRLHKAGVLDKLILIGSWCIYFYKDYFSNVSYIDHIAIRTRDLDFLISRPADIRHKADIPELLKDLGFVTSFKGSAGYIKLDHPDLILEFLVPEKGKGISRPYPLPNLGVNAVTLRFLSFLSDSTIKIEIEDFNLILPHPVNFALHKLIIYQRRIKEEKAIKDKNTAVKILKALINKGEESLIKKVFNCTNKKWQKKITDGLEEMQEKEILNILKHENRLAKKNDR